MPTPEESGETARIAEIVDRLENYYQFECEGGPLKNCVEWRQLKEYLLSRLSASPADVGPTSCTCWLSTSSTFGLSEDRRRCAVHGDHVQQAADIGPQAQGITAPADTDRLRWTIDNVYTIARREYRRVEDGKPLRPEMWGHLLRLCESVGAQSRTVGVLREEPAGTVSQAQEKACQWEEDSSGDFWIAACEGLGGELWTFTDGGPVENKLRHCPYCGKRVQVTGVASPSTAQE